jgi:bacterioferritin
MEMRELNESKVCDILNKIVEMEMAGVVRYAHSSLMITGPNRIPIVAFLQEQANESLMHALQAGEYITGFGGHPSQKISPIEETHNHSVNQILLESLGHEMSAVEMYKRLLEEVADSSIMLEEYARGQIGMEEQHALEITKMLKDYTI